MTKPTLIRNRLLAIIAAVLVIFALQASYPVTMPVAAAAVVMAAVWPVKPWLDRILPSSLATAGTIVVLLTIFFAFLVALYFSAAQVVQTFTTSQERFQNLYDDAIAWAASWGLRGLGGQAGYEQLVAFGRTLLSSVYSVLVHLGFIGILVSLALPEVPAFYAKLRHEFGATERREAIAAIEEIAGKIRSYVGVTTFTSLLTGATCALWAAVMGVELALVWGILNFLLNYIPVIGNIVGIIPPSLYALIQYGSWTMAVIVFIGFCIIQVVISNFVYPLVQGHSLSLSPVAIVVALAFWSWVWGIAGALIAVPLTAALVIVCEHFPGTRWIAKLLSSAC